MDDQFIQNLRALIRRLADERPPKRAPRKLAGNRPDYGAGLYSGQSRLAEQSNAGKGFGPEEPLGSGPVYLDYVGKDTFYVWLASLRGQLFRDDDFAEIYCPDNGRDRVPVNFREL